MFNACGAKSQLVGRPQTYTTFARILGALIQFIDGLTGLTLRRLRRETAINFSMVPIYRGLLFELIRILGTARKSTRLENLLHIFGIQYGYEMVESGGSGIS